MNEQGNIIIYQSEEDVIRLDVKLGIKMVWLTSRERRTIVIEVGMQNAAQAITVACSPFVFNNETIAVPAIIYALMMNIILLIYVFCLGGRRSKV